MKPSVRSISFPRVDNTCQNPLRQAQVYKFYKKYAKEVKFDSLGQTINAI